MKRVKGSEKSGRDGTGSFMKCALRGCGFGCATADVPSSIYDMHCAKLNTSLGGGRQERSRSLRAWQEPTWARDLSEAQWAGGLTGNRYGQDPHVHVYANFACLGGVVAEPARHAHGGDLHRCAR